MIIKIPGNPIALKRPRMSGKTVFDSQIKAKHGLKWVIKSQWIHDPLNEPVILDIVFHFSMPKSWSKKKRLEYLDKPHTNTPDLDNLVKWVCDLFNDIVFKDDRQVYKISAVKKYSEKGQTIVKILNAPTQ